MLKIENLNFAYKETVVLKDVNMQIEAGSIMAILGQSGAGKTTLLKCLGRFIKSKKSAIKLDDKDIQDYSEKEFRQKIGIVFQELHLFPHLTVMENMTLSPRKVLEQDKEECEKEARIMLERLGIGDLEDRYPSQISGGQAQRIAIARALMLKPEFMLLDEPTAALDVNTTDEFALWLQDLKDITTFIIVTHDIPFASKVASHGVLLENGKIAIENTDMNEIINRISSTSN